MTEATYTAWDGKLYEWPPPQGWYEASDGLWWPEGYGPRPESEIETGADLAAGRGTVAGGEVEADGTGNGASEMTMTDDDVPVGTASYPSSTGFDTGPAAGDASDSSASTRSHTGSSYASGPSTGSTPAADSSWAPPDSGSSADVASSFIRSDGDTSDAPDSSAAAAAAITGDHKPMTAWVAESADTPVADILAGVPLDSSSKSGPGEWADRSTDPGLQESLERRDRDDDAPEDSQFGTPGAAAVGAATAGLTDLAGETGDTGGELFSRLQAEARRADVTGQVAAGSAAVSDAEVEAVNGTAPDVVSDAVSDLVADAAADASPDVVSDAVSDLVADAAPDASPDVVSDAVSGVVADAAADASPDVVSETGSLEFDGEPTTTEQPVIDTTSRSEFSGRFGSVRPGFANSAYDEPAYEEPAFGQAAGGVVSTDDAGTETTGQPSDEAAHADAGHESQAYVAPGTVETEPGDTHSYDAQGFTPSQAPPSYDAPGHDAEAPTDPGFVGEHEGDHQVVPEGVLAGRPPGQPSSLDYESPRAAVSPMDAPTPSAGPGRRIFYAVLGVLALVAAGVAGYLAFQLQNDSDDAGTDNTGQSAAQGGDEAAIGSLANPHDPGTGIRIEYPDGAETQSWTLQLQSVESDGADGEARLAMQLVNDELEGQGQLSDLLLALVDADGNDLASAPSPCQAGDSLDLASSLDAGQSVSGPVCWAVGGTLPDNALLAVESTKAQGRVYISLP